MKYKNISRATFLARPNRFIAEVDIDGHKETVHVKNTGRCKELLIPGCEVWLTAPGNSNRKTKYDLVAVRKDTGVLFNIDSNAPNMVMKEWLVNQGFSRIVPEYTYGNSRIDFYMESLPMKNSLREWAGLRPETSSGQYMERDTCGVVPQKFLMEVKGCTLEKDGIGYFPDAPTERGVKHIRELIKAKREGYEAMLAFVIQMDGVSHVLPNTDTHPEFGVALNEAIAAGVKVLCFTCHAEPDELVISGVTVSK